MGRLVTPLVVTLILRLVTLILYLGTLILYPFVVYPLRLPLILPPLSFTPLPLLHIFSVIPLSFLYFLSFTPYPLSLLLCFLSFIPYPLSLYPKPLLSLSFAP